MIAIEKTGGGPPLVLLHGLGTSRLIWRRAAELLAENHLVVAPDLPGFGESPPAGPGFELDEVADTLAAGLIDAVDPPFDLLGNSLGGAIALVLSLRRPDLVRRLVLSAPAGFTPRDTSLGRVLGVAGEGLLKGRALLSPLVASGAARRALLWGAVADPSAISAADARMMVDAPRAATRIGAAIASVVGLDLHARLGELSVPLGLIWGESDRVIPIATLSRIREAVPEVPVETLAGVGHVPQLDAPQRFAGALERVLGQLDTVTTS